MKEKCHNTVTPSIVPICMSCVKTDIRANVMGTRFTSCGTITRGTHAYGQLITLQMWRSYACLRMTLNPTRLMLPNCRNPTYRRSQMKFVAQYLKTKYSDGSAPEGCVTDVVCRWKQNRAAVRSEVGAHIKTTVISRILFDHRFIRLVFQSTALHRHCSRSRVDAC